MHVTFFCMEDMNVHCPELSTQTIGLAPISRAQQHLECLAVWFLCWHLKAKDVKVRSGTKLVLSFT